MRRLIDNNMRLFYILLLVVVYYVHGRMIPIQFYEAENVNIDPCCIYFEILNCFFIYTLVIKQTHHCFLLLLHLLFNVMDIFCL